MADVTLRFSWQNWCQLTNTSVTASSQNVSYPDDWLKDPLRSKTWRSKTGWTITTGFNNKLDFYEAVTCSLQKSAAITAGTYESGTSMAHQIQTQVNAVSTVSCGTPYTVTYSSTSHKFTITRSSTKAVFGMNLTTGTNKLASIAKCLGFNATSNLVAASCGTASYTGNNAVYQSRHWVKFNLGAARDVQVALLHYTNLNSSNASVVLEGHTTSAWSAPTVSTGITLGDIGYKWMSSALSYRHWRFVINNTKDSAGYTYVGVPYLGEYLQPSPGISYRFAEDWDELSSVGFADQGAQFQTERDRARTYSLVFPGLTTNEKNKLKSMAAFVKVGRPYFFSLDPQNDPDDALYVINIRGMNIQSITPSYWQVSMDIAEAIG